MKFVLALLISFYFISLSFEAPPKTIFIAGDSTADGNGGHNGQTEGWGKYLGKYVTSSK
jgi:lysophospholipase L1-like esterase